jgi:hypothetical protein
MIGMRNILAGNLINGTVHSIYEAVNKIAT